jgi:hypothetical protein
MKTAGVALGRRALRRMQFSGIPSTLCTLRSPSSAARALSSTSTEAATSSRPATDSAFRIPHWDHPALGITDPASGPPPSAFRPLPIFASRHSHFAICRARHPKDFPQPSAVFPSVHIGMNVRPEPNRAVRAARAMAPPDSRPSSLGFCESKLVVSRKDLTDLKRNHP